MPTFVAGERAALCETARSTGPDAPTLCEGWTVRDLLVHLARRAGRLREKPAGLPFDDLVDLVRSGPPAWSPARFGPVAELVDLAEFTVHHEDVRRGAGAAEPRELPRGQQQALWRTVSRLGRLSYRKSPTGVVLVVPQGPRVVVKRGADAVSITGEPLELLLHAFGRRERARVEIDGSPATLARFTA
ncbi:maleylpyruvate isomerase family mycothiol-dependent enzyme [Kineococcus gynurae]|uniref:Maleylpyruvate isomerase family mycothiol-dependent enzyme n=1 Tax=Kineococcus gynurae TaxID=452979 RepID=A0ABV5LQG5_9ACTN